MDTVLVATLLRSAKPYNKLLALANALATAQALAAIEALVAGAVTDGHAAAVGASGGVLLEVGDGLA